jgi:rRNA processing protein Gar1
VVLAVTPTGQLTVRSTGARFPTEGTAVRDRSGRHHGRVMRVFGPVAQPYLAVRLRRAVRATEGAELVGAMLVREKEGNDGTE